MSGNTKILITEIWIVRVPEFSGFFDSIELNEISAKTRIKTIIFKANFVKLYVFCKP